MSCPFAKTLVIRRDLHDARDVQVEIAPKVDQLVPRRVCISLQRNPGILLITIKYEIVLELRAHEPLMVIRSRVDQVPNYLTRAPLARPRTPARLVLTHLLQKGRRTFDCL